MIPLDTSVQSVKLDKSVEIIQQRLQHLTVLERGQLLSILKEHPDMGELVANLILTKATAVSRQDIERIIAKEKAAVATVQSQYE